MNNGIIKPKSRNEKNNLTILKLRKESNTFDYSLMRKEIINNPKIKSRNINKDISRNQQVSKRLSMSSSFQNRIFLNKKSDVIISSSSNSERRSEFGSLHGSIKQKIESALVSNKILLNNLFSRNNAYKKNNKNYFIEEKKSSSNQVEDIIKSKEFEVEILEKKLKCKELNQLIGENVDKGKPMSTRNIDKKNSKRLRIEESLEKIKKAEKGDSGSNTQRNQDLKTKAKVDFSSGRLKQHASHNKGKEISININNIHNSNNPTTHQISQLKIINIKTPREKMAEKLSHLVHSSNTPSNLLQQSVSSKHNIEAYGSNYNSKKNSQTKNSQNRTGLKVVPSNSDIKRSFININKDLSEEKEKIKANSKEIKKKSQNNTNNLYVDPPEKLSNDKSYKKIRSEKILETNKNTYSIGLTRKENRSITNSNKTYNVNPKLD